MIKAGTLLHEAEQVIALRKSAFKKPILTSRKTTQKNLIYAKRNKINKAKLLAD
jgi:hypothetical protein